MKKLFYFLCRIVGLFGSSFGLMRGVTLMGGTAYQGTVLVYLNGQWGTICDDGFSGDDAKVVCYLLGFSR